MILLWFGGVVMWVVDVDADDEDRILGMSLSNGGPAGGIWMFLVVCCGMFFVTLSMAEMASM